MKTKTSLNAVMKQLILDFNVGSVATINQDGSPAVSPKATFVVVDDTSIAYGDIRSPGTRANLVRDNRVEAVFTDVLTRQALRITGVGRIVGKDSEQGKVLVPLFKQLWEPYIDYMSAFVKIDISQAELILSPAYDLGISQAELVKTNFEKLTRIANEMNLPPLRGMK